MFYLQTILVFYHTFSLKNDVHVYILLCKVTRYQFKPSGIFFVCEVKRIILRSFVISYYFFLKV